MTAYDDQNIFAKILRGEIPSEKVYEDEETVVIMDIMPWADGHCLVLPKEPARNILDVSASAMAAVAETTRMMSVAVKKAFDADGVTIQQNNEAAGNQVVFHLHVHVIPRRADERLQRHNQTMEDKAVLKANADRIRSVLEN